MILVTFEAPLSKIEKNVSKSAFLVVPDFGYPQAQLEKVFLPPGSGFLRRNFPNIDDEFS